MSVRVGSWVVVVAISAIACGRVGFDRMALDAAARDGATISADGTFIDAGRSDAAIVDGGSVDTGPRPDAAIADGGAIDSGGQLDAELMDVPSDVDADIIDAEVTDSGAPDADGFDAGSIDAGPPSDPVAHLGVGLDHVCAVTGSSTAQCWGANGDGQLGDGTRDDSPTPVDVSMLPESIAAISSGRRFSCVLTDTDAVRCWGANNNNQLGNATADPDSPVPLTISGTRVGLSTLSTGKYYALMIAQDTISGWGPNRNGELADGTTTLRLSPVDAQGFGAPVDAIATGNGTPCAISNGEVYCWGRNDFGQVGDGTTMRQEFPTLVMGIGSGATAVSAGAASACAVVGGAAYCWGNNTRGQLGNGSMGAPSLVAVPVMNLQTGVTLISVGGHQKNDERTISHACAVVNGIVECWGDNTFGQLGDGTNVSRATPAAVSAAISPSPGDPGSSSVVALSVAFNISCAMMDDGAVWCWGTNALGQLGDGTTMDRNVPTRSLF